MNGYRRVELFPEEDEWRGEWRGMPEFISEPPSVYKAIKVKFASPEDYRAFMRCIDEQLTGQTRSIWFPSRQKVSRREYRYVNEEE